MRRFYIEPANMSAADVEIRGDDARHIRNVLRMTAGDHVILFDGTGEEHEAKITAVSGDAVSVRVVKRFSASLESPLNLAVAQGLLKDKKMDGLIRHLTELGMTRWVPFQADRSIPIQDEKKRRAHGERWEKIAREALKQCGRSRPPQVGSVVSFADMITAAEGYSLKLFFWEQADAGLPGRPASEKAGPLSVFTVLGPEGGFNEHEAARAADAGFAIVSLGPRILRAETAALAACALVQYRYGDMADGRPKTP
ncbi:MAG: 16S rRNA (uracil(1498)-N(3))-methyltransferase [Pseudomonadota bacterium]